VTVIRLCTENSHDEWRDSVQASKTLLDSACKSYDDATLQTITELLNSFGQKEIVYIQDYTELGRMRYRQHLKKWQSEADEAVGGRSEEEDRPRGSNHFSKPPPKSTVGYGGIAVQPGDELESVDDTDDEDEDNGEEDAVGEPDAEGEVEISTTNVGGGAKGLDTINHEVTVDNEASGSTDIGGGTRLKRAAATKVSTYDEAIDADVLERDIEMALTTRGKSRRSKKVEDAEFLNLEPDDEDDDDDPYRDVDADQLAREMAHLTAPISTTSAIKREKQKQVKDNKSKIELDCTDDPIDWKSASSLLNPFNDSVHKMLSEDRDQTDYYYSYIGTLDRKKTYTKTEVLSSHLVLERGLRLLHRIRFGQFEPNLRITPYINYAAIGGGIGTKIQERIKQECKPKEGRRLTVADPGVIDFMRNVEIKVCHLLQACTCMGPANILIGVHLASTWSLPRGPFLQRRGAKGGLRTLEC
jgi:hypothetical protein